MNRRRLHCTLAGIVIAMVLGLPATVQACSACMGDVNSKTAGAINAAMFLMIGFVGMMMASLGGFAFYLSRRADAPAPPYAELDPSNTDPDDLS